MLKSILGFGAAILALAVPTVTASAVVGPDAARCRSGSAQPAFLVNVSGFKSRSGSLRVQIYGPNPSDFLERGKYVRRVDVPITSNAMQVCVALPGTGRYAVAVRHDADGNHRSGWNDGGGFSNNPHLSMTNLKPSYGRVAVSVGNGVRPVNVILNYRQGFTIAPIG